MLERQFPQNIEAEQGLLGSILINPEVLDSVADFLRPEDFYRDAHKTIYTAMLRLYERHEPPDTIMVSDELELRGVLQAVGGFSYLASLVDGVPISSHAEYYGKIIAKASEHRKIIHAAGRMAALAYEQTDDALALAEELLYRISQGKQVTQVSSLADVMGRYLRTLDALHEQRLKGVVTGVPTGFPKLDHLTGGLQPSDLITLAARPSYGKSSLALNIAQHVMEHSSGQGFRVLMFSLEMGETQLARRLLSMETGIDQARLRMADIYEGEWERIIDAGGKLSDGKMWIDDTPGLALSDMRSRARRTQREHGLDLVIVDYMQLMRATNERGKMPENRVQEVSLLSRGLKELARELVVPVLALAQLSRAVENRLDKVPQLSDLRESGTIEADSDVVMFIHCTEQEEKKKMMTEPYLVNIMVSKHRNGAMGVVKLHFEPTLTKFFTVEEREQQ